MKKLVFTSVLLLPATAFCATGNLNTVVIHPQDVSAVMQMFQADAFSQKIIEYGATGVIGACSVGWFALLGREAKSAYGELRHLGTEAVGFFANSGIRAGGELAGSGLRAGGELAGSAGKKLAGKALPATRNFTRNVGSGIGSVIRTGKSSVVSQAPTKAFSDFAGSSAVDVSGRKLTADALAGNSVRGESIRKLSVGDKVFNRTKTGWKFKDGHKLATNVSDGQVKSLLDSDSVHSAKATYADGTEALLTKNADGSFNEHFTNPSDVASKERMSFRNSGKPIRIDNSKLDRKDFANVVDNAPAGTNFAVYNVQGKNITFKKTKNGLELSDKLGLGRDDEFYRHWNNAKTINMDTKNFLDNTLDFNPNKPKLDNKHNLT